MPLHVTFNTSGAGSLMQALWLAESRDPVVCLWDELCIGRLDSVEARAAWMFQILDEERYAEMAVHLEEAWSQVVDPQVDLIVWFGRRSANEYLGLLELLARRGGGGVLVIDVCKEPVSTRSCGVVDVRHQGEVRSQQLAMMLQAGRAIPVPPDSLEDARTLWPRLKAENASLRVFGPDGLASMPITYFDQALIDATPTGWTSQERVGGQILGTRSDAQDAGYSFLLDRLYQLIEDGRLESQENPIPDRGWLIRRPSK